MRGRTLHVLGSGDAERADNHIFRARLQAVLDVTNNWDKAIIYGRQQTGMLRSEAASAVAYLMTHCVLGNPDLVTNEAPKSTSETMTAICRLIQDDLSNDRRMYDPYGREISRVMIKPNLVITNWPYMARTRYLMRKQWQRLYPEIPWAKARTMLGFQAVGGTFVPYLRHKGVQAIPWWLWAVAVRECLSWVKALYDPYDTKLNQGRGWARIFKA